MEIFPHYWPRRLSNARISSTSWRWSDSTYQEHTNFCASGEKSHYWKTKQNKQTDKSTSEKHFRCVQNVLSQVLLNQRMNSRHTSCNTPTRWNAAWWRKFISWLQSLSFEAKQELSKFTPPWYWKSYSCHIIYIRHVSQNWPISVFSRKAH